MTSRTAGTSRTPGGTRSAGRGAASTTGRPRSERARDAILRATLKLLERQGIDDLTIEGIAAEAGVGKATIYRWWPSRVAVVLEAIEQLPDLDAPDLGSFAADLRALLRDFADLLVSTPLGGVLAHLGADVANREPEVDAYLARRMAGPLVVVERAIARGELPRDTDARSVVYIAMGPVLNRCFYGSRPDDEFLDLVVATLTIGLPVALGRTSASRGASARHASR